MLDNLTTLLTPEWWKLIKPKQLPAYAMRALRIATDRLSDADQVSSTASEHPATRARYTVLDIPLERIVQNQYRAGDDVNVLTVAGSQKNSEWTYYIDALPTGLTLIGSTTMDQFLLRGADFKECGTGYLFRDNPAEHGTIIHRGKGVRCIFLAVGGPMRITHRPQDAIYYSTATDPIAIKAIGNVLTDAQVTCGISGTTVNAARSVGVPMHADLVYRVWTEGSYDFLQLDSGDVCTSRCSHKNDIQPQSSIQKGAQWTTADQQSAEIFYFPLSGSYAAGIMGDMRVADFPNILEEYPDLPVISGVFQGADLAELLKTRGCNLLNVWYGIPDSGTQRALGRYLVQDGMQLTQQCITAEITMSECSLSDSGAADNSAESVAESISMTDSAKVQFIV